MKIDGFELEFVEPERCELHEPPFYHFEISRRDFVQALGAGLVLSVAIPSGLAQRSRGAAEPTLAQRLHIGADGLITVLSSKVEVGQGSRTQLTQAAAEELEVSVHRVRMILADTSATPDDGGTAGSRTTPATVPAVRKACAAARQLLIDTAAAEFNADPKRLSVRDGKVAGLGPGQTFGYVELAKPKHTATLEKSAAPGTLLKTVAEWKTLGTPLGPVNARDIVTGAHRFPSDIRRPNMLFGKVLRPPKFGAAIEDANLDSTNSFPAAISVRDGDFIGFAAPTSLEAEQARDEAARHIRWKTSPHPSSEELFAHLRSHASATGRRQDVIGSPEQGFQAASKVLRAHFHIAYIQHAPMEPRAAVAEWNDGKLTVWTGSQQPSRVRDELARAFRLSNDRVRVVVPDTGGGFGGKHSGEAAVEAARLALAAKKPVSLRWTREEEFTWAYFRPAGVIDVAGGLDASGRLVAWEQINFNSGTSALATPYLVPNSAAEFKTCDQPLRSGSYRALASTANAFARESMMDELAAAAGADPLEFRLQHLDEKPGPAGRLRGVLVAATERFGWRREWRPQSTGAKSGVGLGCGTEKGSFVACCVRLDIDPDAKTYKVRHVCIAFECGAIQNPLNLKAQIEGCVIQGLGGAQSEEMRFKEGSVLNASFGKYRVPRFRDVPVIDTILVNRPDLVSAGAGETPIIGIAPAIANALCQATGVRIRSMPIRDERFRAA